MEKNCGCGRLSQALAKSLDAITELEITLGTKALNRVLGHFHYPTDPSYMPARLKLRELIQEEFQRRVNL
jgi:hypothetical protein